MNTPCTISPFTKNVGGYAHRRVDGKTQFHHRLAYCEAHGIPLEAIDGLVVRHSCDNPPCINPQHLLLGTHTDNSQDKVDRERQARGAALPHTKLTHAQVAEIKRRYVPRCKVDGATALAKEFGVTQSNVSKLLHGSSWTYVKE